MSSGVCIPPCDIPNPTQLPSPWPVATVPPGSVVPAAPTLSRVSPDAVVFGPATVDNPALTPVYFYGSNFTQGSVIMWNGSAEPTQFIASNLLSTNIDRSTIAVETVIDVAVQNPDGATTDPLKFAFVERPILIEPTPTPKVA